MNCLFLLLHFYNPQSAALVSRKGPATHASPPLSYHWGYWRAAQTAGPVSDEHHTYPSQLNADGGCSSLAAEGVYRGSGITAWFASKGGIREAAFKAVRCVVWRTLSDTLRFTVAI